MTRALLRPQAEMAMRLLVIAVWFVGLAFIAVTPPFEGFDETAH